MACAPYYIIASIRECRGRRKEGAHAPSALCAPYICLLLRPRPRRRGDLAGHVAAAGIDDGVGEQLGDAVVAPVVHVQPVARGELLERDAACDAPVAHDGVAVEH